VKADEWDAIPEIGDYTIKKRKTMQSFVPIPDTLLSKVRGVVGGWGRVACVRAWVWVWVCVCVGGCAWVWVWVWVCECVRLAFPYTTAWIWRRL